MNRARTFPPSPAFSALAVALSSQLADFEEAGDSDGAGHPFFEKWCATEKTLTRMPVETAGDLLLKIEVLAQIAEHSEIDHDEWKALGRDAERLNGPGMAFVPEAWLRRWTNRGGGYVRTDGGVSFVAPEPPTVQQRFMLDELQRADGHQAVADVIDGRVEPPATEWSALQSAFIDAAASLPEEASDDELDAYWAAWEAAMLGEAETADAIRWKITQLVSQTLEAGGEFSNDDELMAAIMADVSRHAVKGGAS